MNESNSKKRVIGLALGSGSARGWAHIGVIRELSKHGIRPDIVCGTSIGSLVGAFYASDRLKELEGWVMKLDRKIMFHYLDIKMLMGGGFVEGKRLVDFFRERIGDPLIEDLSTAFAAVATDMESGQEVWLKKGSLLNAIRASIALPGIFTPVSMNDRWLVDGGLVNPVPISLCRAMGAEIVIAVNLNGNIVGKHRKKRLRTIEKDIKMSAEATLIDRLSEEFKQKANAFLSQLFNSNIGTPGLFEVVSSSINIMQDSITRSRMAGEPPDVVIAPRLAHIGLLEFDRAKEAIKEGRESAKHVLPIISDLSSW